MNTTRAGTLLTKVRRWPMKRWKRSNNQAGVTAENIRALNVKMIDMACANAEATFDLAFQIATAKTPSDIIELWSRHARKQFELLGNRLRN